jgi:hypothetical protein
MRYVWLACMISSAAFAETAELKRVPYSTFDRGLPAFGRLADGTVAARGMQLDAKMPSGAKRNAQFLVLFDPVSGCFQWLFGYGNPANRTTYLDDFSSGHNAIFAADHKLIVFSLSSPSLGVRESTEVADGIDDADTKSLRAAIDSASEYESGASEKHWRRISLLSLGLDFWAPKGSAAFGPAKILKVSREGSNWNVIIQAQWKSKIVLNDQYEIVKAEKTE